MRSFFYVHEKSPPLFCAEAFVMVRPEQRFNGRRLSLQLSLAKDGPAKERTKIYSLIESSLFSQMET